MLVYLAVAARRIGSAERWDALPAQSFEDAGEGEFLTAKPTKSKKSRKKRAVKRPLKGDVRTISQVVTHNRAP